MRISVVALVALVVAARVASAQTSPGPLAAGHAAIATCDGCHADIAHSPALAPARCLACHTELGARVAAGRGLHGSKLVAGKQCQSCHHEHKGARYDPTGWTAIPGGRDGFDHGLTGWALDGKHRLAACGVCHRSHDRQGLETFLGTSAQCSACHAAAQPHQITRAALLDCGRCHSTRGWKPVRTPLAFDHDVAADARMPLQGVHATLSCAKCHPRAVFNLMLANPSRCDSAGCHANEHAGQLFGNRPCDWCHAAATFGHVSFDHKARTTFDLGPAHRLLPCEQCHTASLGPRLPSPACADCHHTAVAYADRRFDHGAHDAALAGGHQSAGCVRCHATTGDPATAVLVDVRTSKPANHARCSGTGCHTAFASNDCQAIKQARVERVCATCHQPKGCAVFPAKPTTAIRARFGHGHHAELGASVDAACLACHDARTHGATVPAGGDHLRCAGCHAKDPQLPMSRCDACHAPTAPRPLVVLLDDPLHVAKRFKHDGHARHAAGGCTGCHGKPNTATADAAVRATMTAVDARGTCARCHAVGGAAFSVTSHCARCHDEPRPAKGAPAAFSHDAHRARYGARPFACLACHALGADGLVASLLENKEHLPCAEAGCHGTTDFADRNPTRCVICHADGAAWTQPRLQPQVGEWHPVIDHARHLVNPNLACTTCHGDKLASAHRPRNHEACALCHGKGQPPPMARCEACHARTPQGRPASAWSVAATFDHQTHRLDPRSGAPTTCTTCHVGIDAAATLAAIARPTMAACDACHDGVVQREGRAVFKTTGFGCVRCHRK